MRDDRFFLRMIIDHCEDIEACAEAFGNDEEEFLSNKIFQASCAFHVSQIGENVKMLSSELINDHSDIQWKEIAGLRNIIVHDYGKVRIESLWITVTKWVPELKESCKRILARIQSEQ